ncbi:DNA-binding response regulator [Cupriavidus sp. USMAA2-4]|uniref:DNA-binding response regulator n=1 Tax=Cupriavidus malaysiensis TaxID=367825 RepID=A0ABM6F454_9BURK|nr:MULTISPECIES: response regulator transcription factor [Cupriavidus]AOY90835.1 DNA-binding response regulator [Cupriavidus sp. USMAA2-4]AOY99559.1 DNA-binding response regulator [Cupriavidus sp. USMAHM13]AOZ06207.1 DNA-binding response regulator [Cupriavidus malaysiensis]
MRTILLLEDESELRDEIAAFLQKRQWAVLQAGSLAEFAPLCEQADIAVIDAMLPDGSGFDAVRALRRQRPGCGIVMLTARGETHDKLQGFDGGADHYLVKPVKLLEFDAVLRALSRRVATSWRLDRQAGRLSSPDGAAIAVSVNEGSLLELLARHPGQPASRREIVESFGEDWRHYDERRLETLVSRLRQRWRGETASELPLRAAHGVGYVFAASLSLA